MKKVAIFSLMLLASVLSMPAENSPEVDAVEAFIFSITNTRDSLRKCLRRPANFYDEIQGTFSEAATNEVDNELATRLTYNIGALFASVPELLSKCKQTLQDRMAPIEKVAENLMSTDDVLVDVPNQKIIVNQVDVFKDIARAVRFYEMGNMNNVAYAVGRVAKRIYLTHLITIEHAPDTAEFLKGMSMKAIGYSANFRKCTADPDFIFDLVRKAMIDQTEEPSAGVVDLSIMLDSIVDVTSGCKVHREWAEKLSTWAAEYSNVNTLNAAIEATSKSYRSQEFLLAKETMLHQWENRNYLKSGMSAGIILKLLDEQGP